MLRLIMLLVILSVCRTALAAETTLKVDPARVITVQGEVRNLREDIFKLAMMALENSKPVYIMLDTPGGGVNAGMEFIDAMHKLQSRGIEIRCFAKTALSMGLAIFSECDKRYAHKASELMWHPVKAYGTDGLSADDAEKLMKELREYDEKVWNPTKKKLRVSDSVWMEHYKKETIHSGENFKKLAPHYVEIVDTLENYEFRIFNDPVEELLKQLFPGLGGVPKAPIAPFLVPEP